jgi:transposase
MGQASLIIGRERRRRFTEGQKFELLTAAFGAGGNVAEVARRADICTSLLYRWRRAHLAAQTPAFVPAVVRDEDQAASLGSRGSPAAIVVELTRGVRVQINAAAPASLVEATLRALR